MLIDWYTVGAQVLNFLLLVWLMKRFLYQPILHAIDEREKRIATKLSDADEKQVDAQKERDDFHRKNEELDQQRAALLQRTTDDAKVERDRLVEEARTAVNDARAKREEALRKEAGHLHQAIGRRAQQEVFSIARKALADLASSSLEQRMCEVFVRRLHEIDGATKHRLTAALATSSTPVLVRSAFELPPDQRATIQRALDELVAAGAVLRFETAPAIVSGIELSANGERVAWSIADYLTSLEKSVAELLPFEPARETITEAKPNAAATPEPHGSEVGSTKDPKPAAEPAAKPAAEPAAKPAPKPAARGA